MSFPQPSSNGYTAKGYKFFRLNTLLSSPGDMYESEVGGLGMALGPQSDIALVNVAYFDNQAPTFLQLTQISPARSFVGQISAANADKYDPAQRPGRILIWPGNLYDPNFRPPGFDPDHDQIQFIAPRLDVIQFFSDPGALVPTRNDQEYQFQNYIVSGTLSIVVPYYGRKYAYVEFTNRNATDPNTFGIFGVNYAITDDSSTSPPPYHQVTTIRAPGAVASNTTVTKIITAGTTGMFDALIFSVNNLGPAPLRIVTSDQSQGT